MEQSKVRYELYEMATASSTSSSDSTRFLAAFNDPSSLLGHFKNAPMANTAPFMINDLDVLASSVEKLNLVSKTISKCPTITQSGRLPSKSPKTSSR